MVAANDSTPAKSLADHVHALDAALGAMATADDALWTVECQIAELPDNGTRFASSIAVVRAFLEAARERGEAALHGVNAATKNATGA